MDHLLDRWLSIKEICAYFGLSDANDGNDLLT